MAEDSTAHAWLFPRVLPQNSERLTLRLLQAMAMELGLPTNATKEDLRQMIDGQLNERGKDPLNVQVLLCQEEGEVRSLTLSDEEGDFLRVDVFPRVLETSVKSEPSDLDGERSSLEEESGDLETEQETREPQASTQVLEETLQETRQQMETLSCELQRKQEQVEALEADLEEERAHAVTLGEEVRHLNHVLSHEKERMRRVWIFNCEQLRLLDDECGRCVRECVSKDNEIGLLRRRVRELETKDCRADGVSVVNTTRITSAPTSTCTEYVTGVTPESSRGPPIPAPIPTPCVMPVTRVAPEISLTPGLERRVDFSSPVATPLMRVCPNEAVVGNPAMVVASPCQTSRASALVVTSPSQSCREMVVTTTNTTHTPAVEVIATPGRTVDAEDVVPVRKRLGKGPPVDPFTGEQVEVRFEDWLPTLERAATWYGWSSEEQLMQLAGHLRGKALQEWNLMGQTEKSTYKDAASELSRRLDPGGRIMAVQDFRHTVQKESESVADYLRRLERSFQLAYGRDNLKSETKETMLYSQLQEGLLLGLVRSSSVSGCLTYKELCVAAKQEEKRLADFRRRQQYHQGIKSNQPKPPDSGRKVQHQLQEKQKDDTPRPPADYRRRPRIRTCHNCGSPDHFMRDCKATSQESGKSSRQTQLQPQSGAKKLSVVRTSTEGSEDGDNPMSYLRSPSDSDDESKVDLVRVTFDGSSSRRVLVEVQGIPVTGVVDTGADISIMGAELFKTIAAATRMTKKCLKPVDKSAFTFDHKPIRLDGKLELDIVFDGKTLCTPIYLKMDSTDQLLLSEGVCRQLGIVSYHPSVLAKKRSTATEKSPVRVPMVRVSLLESVSVPPQRCITAKAKLEGGEGLEGPVLLEQALDSSTATAAVRLTDSLLNRVDPKEAFQVILENPSGFTQKVEKDTHVGLACQASQVLEGESDLPECEPEPGEEVVVRLIAGEEERKKCLAKLLVGEGQELKWQHRDKLYSLLLAHHSAFALDKDERGETDLVQMEILTGDSAPKRQPVRRTPFAVRGEVARQLREMQENGVISPSSSPWASPVVLVRKKDGTLRFCIDYRELNSVTKADTFPLPRIDDLLDQLNNAEYFSTLDLASGFWQVQVHPTSKEKTAFVTQQGLYQFNVMPFGLRNAPAVFQRLMQCVLSGLNPEGGVPFTSVYIDDILIFSRTFEEHLQHLKAVIERVSAAGLKLKPTKCKFIRQRVEYLGHILTPNGICPNPDRVSAVQQFPRPTSVREVRQFLGLASYYRRFVKGFANVAQPLHALTKANSRFSWTVDCQVAFDTLKSRLLMSPVLSFPDFARGFILETDASIKGLGAVLSQRGEDSKIHPVAYASRALTQQEQRYSVTELETLAVVWAVKHYHAYLYGHDVVIYTDHSAVKAILNNPHSNGKHARWWSHVYGSGIRNLDIVYRAGRDNANADALSRNPVLGPTELVTDVQVASIDSVECGDLLQMDPDPETVTVCDLSAQQAEDPECRPLLDFLLCGKLPGDPAMSKKIAAQAPQFDIVDGVLCFFGPKSNGRGRQVVPRSLRKTLIEGYHGSSMSGHFSAPKLIKAISRHWWWQGMHKDITEHCNSCLQCTVVNASGRVHQPLLKPIPVQRAFQIIGVDVMELPKTKRGNKYVAVFQDFLTKWPFVFAMPDQKAIRLVKLLVEEVIPFTGVPECLLSDRGTNLLSHLMTDVCALLGVKKLNTTSYHPACDGLVERFNRTLKTALRKRAADCGDQWDQYLSGVVWAYRNVPHESTGEKPSFLLFGVDLRSPTEAALLPPSPLTLTEIDDYREELVFSLSSARQLAANCIKAAQQRYKKYHDRHATPYRYRVGTWVFIRFPQEETGRLRKLSRPWHGPYRVVSVQDPDVCAVKVYFPDEGQIRVHQSRVKPCPLSFPAGSYWYKSRKSQGRVPRWVQRFLSDPGLSQPQSGEVQDSPLDLENLFSQEETKTDDSEPERMAENLDLGPDELDGDSFEQNSVSEVLPQTPAPVCSGTSLDPVDSVGKEPSGSPVTRSRHCGRYTLRHSVNPPQRLCRVDQPGRLAPKGEVM